jgi:prepilin-type N-terminal cleavage/methylation domain-containing protein
MICLKNQLKFLGSEAGFTIIELLVVIALIGMLTSIVLVSLNLSRASSRDAVRMSGLRSLQEMLEIHQINAGNYPFSTDDFQIQGQPWGSFWEEYGTVPKDPLSPNQEYSYVSDEGYDYQVYAKFEREPVDPTFACAGPCGPNGEYNGGIASAGTSLIAFEPTPPGEEPPPPGGNGLPPGGGPPPEEEGEPIVCEPPLASGEQIFAVTTPDNPKITEIVINPLDVNQFATQIVKVSIQETAGKPIIQATGEAKTNSMSFPFELSLISGTDTDGIWQGSWYNEDEYCENYMLIITASSQSGTSKVELTFK